MRTLFFRLWFVGAVGALGRLVSSGQRGRLDPGDVVALVVLLTASIVLGRALYRSARTEHS